MSTTKTTQFIILIIALLVLLIISLHLMSFLKNNNIDHEDEQEQEQMKTLLLVNILFRHGDRSPNYVYPNDPHKHYPWHGGLGALSQKGSLQMYNIGKKLGKRYRMLFPSNGLYTRDNMQVFSSAVERTIMSGASFLAGFMEPIQNQHLLPITWQPIPILVIPLEKDKLLVQTKSCPKYDEHLRKLINGPSKLIHEINTQNTALYKYLTLHTGMNVTTIFDVEILHNILQVQQDAGLPLPEWTKNVFPHKMLHLFEFSANIRTENHFMKKIRGGTILAEFLDNIEMHQTGITPNRTIFIYSAHDITLTYLMRALDCINQTALKPDYGATAVFELHSNEAFDDDDDYEIRIFYYANSDVVIPKDVFIPKCETPCSLKNFTNSFEKLLLRDYDEYCKIN